MINIITSDGIRLDLDPSAEFNIEYENPMLDDERMPVPFSTSISFLPSPTNKKAFGYLDAMMLEPSVLKIGASIEISGMTSFQGTLEYDSIEDGKLNYTFSGSGPATDWAKKIWELNIHEYDLDKQSYFINSVAQGNIDGVTAPLIINKAAVADSIYKPDKGEATVTGSDVKYRNCPIRVLTNGRPVGTPPAVYNFMPVISFDRIINAAGISWSKAPSFEYLHVIGRYHSSFRRAINVIRRRPGITSGTPTETEELNIGDVAETLPDISISDFIRNLAKMKCAAVYVDGGRYAFISFDDVIAAEPANWDSKISDRYSANREEGASYILSYHGDMADSNYDIDNLTDDLLSDKIKSTDLPGILEQASEEYSAFMFSDTGDIYSIRKFTSDGKNAYLADAIWHDIAEDGITDTDTDGDNSFNCDIDFILPECVPDVLYKSDKALYRIAPLINIPENSGQRDSDAYIGYSNINQMSDSGYYFDDNGRQMNMVHIASEDPQVHRINPYYLYFRHHQRFAEWMSKDRQCVSAELKLDGMDLNKFRMYKPVYFRGRRWIVKKLSLTLKAGHDAIGATGEFISLD